MPVIVVSGQPGAGSSTIAKLLAKKLRLKHFSAGKKFKKEGTGKETARAIQFLNTERGSSISYHRAFDKIIIKHAKKGDVVIDAKLGVLMLRKYYDFSVWLKAPKGVRAKRFVKRDKIPVRQALKEVSQRDSIERNMWKKIYGIDYFRQEKKADLVINVANKTPEQIVDLIVSKMKRVFVVHRWEGRPNKDWYNYAKKELERNGYVVNVLKMPNPDAPKERLWVPYLSKAVCEPTEKTFLVGHSAGVITILRYLEQLKKNEKIGGCVLVAGWIDDLGYKELKNFFARPINWPAIKKHCRKFVAIHSDNDPYVKLYHGKAFRKHLKAKLIILHNKGHLTDEDGVKKLPSAVKSIEEF